ncbi:MAG: MerR family transcriptional regulator [Planctomycetota bacterium]|nr:MAG: MerR family transcriptional regulator [Planctomycetota bacterium]
MPAKSTPAPGPALLKIGDFARLAGTNLRTLRYYEELGLMTPAARSDGGFRYYRHCDLNRLNTIRSLQELGLHLDRIRELLDTRKRSQERGAFTRGVQQALDVQDELLVLRIEEIHKQRAKLAEARAKLRECELCQHQPTPENNFCEPCATTGQPLPEKLSALY